MISRDLRTAAERKALSDICKSSLKAFTRLAFAEQHAFRWVHNDHHDAMFDALERVFRGECTRLIINIPPRYSKTEIAVVNFIAWALGRAPDAEFIHVSYSSTLAVSNAANARALVQSDFYRAAFPEVVLRDDSKSKGDWRTTKGGVVYAQGSGGTITGFGAGKMRHGFGGAIIIDDPHKASEAQSDTVRKSVIEWFGNTLESRKNDPERTPIILIMQRLHEADLSGFLLAGGNGETWEHVNLPAIKEDGTALWPAKHTIVKLREMERANPYVFAGQYGQSPAPLAGGEFKPDFIDIVDAVPHGTRMVRGWDLAGTKDGGDYTAGGALGIMPDGRYIVAGMEHDRADPEDVQTMLKATAKRDGTSVTVALPQDPGQAGKAQKRALVRLLAGYSVSSKPVTGDKVTRARPLAAQVNVGNVVMLRGDWNAGMVNEMRSFPNGKHDDQIDALSLAFDELTDNSLGLIDYYKQEAAERAHLQAAANAPTPPPTTGATPGFPWE